MNAYFRWMNRGVAAALVTFWTLPAAPAGERMPADQQNALVQKYCAGCHTDASHNGGLTLEHFDATHLDPSLAAMLASKLRGGALGASGKPMPDQATRAALLSALTAEAAGASEWNFTQREDTMIASTVRELPAAKSPGEPALYRLTLACSARTGTGEMQLSWAPASATGTLNASVDGKAPVTFAVLGEEKMGNGSGRSMGPAAITLKGLGLPLQTLTFGNLFPGETAAFAFDRLPAQARQALERCFQ